MGAEEEKEKTVRRTDSIAKEREDEVQKSGKEVRPALGRNWLEISK